jgi:hypothetical protein
MARSSLQRTQQKCALKRLFVAFWRGAKCSVVIAGANVIKILSNASAMLVGS